ncbi:uncharacterized protein rab11fip5a isoform 1-T1 [Pholidichthys leucotaenia]
MSSLNVEEEHKWLPTHVHVTVLRGRGLRGKGKHGTSDVYTIIQLGKEKYSTGVAEKTTEPEWREECSFELHPGVLERGGERGGYPAGSNEIVLTVMHRALIGLDVFLGQAVVQLDKVFHERRGVKNEWFRLNSKTGKKEKERGDIQVTVKFTRDNLTASMFDLVMKDKGTSTFTKLKDRMRGKRRSSEEDSSSTILPGGYGSLYRMRQRLPSDGGGEEDYEDDEGGEVRRSKMRTFFLRGKLRKSSDTRSSTSLGSESSESSSRGGSLSPTAGISVVVSDLSNSPSNSSNFTADNSPEHTAQTSPKSSSLKCEFGDEAGEITIAVPQPTICINGSHAYNVQPSDPGSGKAAGSLGLGLLQKSLPLSVSLQNLSQPASTDLPVGLVGDGRRWSFDKLGEEEKAAIAAALEKSGPMLGEEEEERLGQAAQVEDTESEVQGKKQRRNLFSHGRSESAGKPKGEAATAEEKHKGWFPSKDSHSKPSLVGSPKLEPCTDAHPPPPSPPASSHRPSGPPIDCTAVVSALHHTNPFSPSQTSPPPPPPHMSSCNPFFSLLQHNPFYEDILTNQQLKPSVPPLPYLSSSRPPIAQLFPHLSNPNTILAYNNPATEDSISGADANSKVMVKLGRRPLPPVPIEGEKPLVKKSPNPFMSIQKLELDSEWDESFEAFAAGRLQSPVDLITDCKMQQNAPGNHGLEQYDEKGSPLHMMDDSDALHDKPFSNILFEIHKATCHVANTNTHHFEDFPQLLKTIPEHRSFETDDFSTNSGIGTETKHSSIPTNDLTNTNTDQAAQLSSSTPDPSSSGLGSSAEDDFLSCVSSYSEKFSASSSEEAESNILGFVRTAECVKNKKPSESDEDAADRSSELSFVDVQETVIHRGKNAGDLNCLEESLTSQPSATEELGTDTETHDNSEAVFQKLTESQPKKDSLNTLKDLNESSGNKSTDMINFTTTHDEHFFNFPTFCITSSPDLEHRLCDPSSERASVSGQESQALLSASGGFLNFSHIGNSPCQEFASDQLHRQASDERSSSVLHRLNIRAESQNYQTSESRLVSRCSSASEPNEALQLQENKTLSGAAVDLLGSTGKEMNQTDRSEESLHVTKDELTTLGHSVSVGDDLYAAIRPGMNNTPKRSSNDSVENCHAALAKCTQTQHAALHRSQSEGTLAPTFEELLPRSFGSDPGAMQESTSTRPDPDLPCPISFSPFLTPESNSSPVVLCTLPPLASASAMVPAQDDKPVPQEEQQTANQQNSPHPVKPLTTATLGEEKRSVLATSLEKLKSTIHPGKSSQLNENETDRKKSLTEGAGSYYHLNHNELVALLVQRENELERQKDRFERQKLLLAKRELELKKLKPQIRDLEDYIDTLLVRIMEEKPTLLQVRSRFK